MRSTRKRVFVMQHDHRKAELPCKHYFLQQGGNANVWYLNSCSCQSKVWADKDGRYMSSAMGESSQVGNILSSRLCVYVSVKVCRAGLVDAWWACSLVRNIWASFWSTRVDSAAAAAQLSFSLLREMKWAWRAPLILPPFILPNLLLLHHQQPVLSSSLVLELYNQQPPPVP